MNVCRRSCFHRTGLLLAAIIIVAVSLAPRVGHATSQPNILLIVADDLGYSDLGAFGSEIATPNLDSLARQGAILTNFHAAPNCAPSRSAMLTGVDAHLAGLGANAGTQASNQENLEAYQGYLRKEVIVVAELLKRAGYHTAMAGKWHLGHQPNNLPGARGFEKSFALLNGGASHWADQAPIIPGQETVYTEDDNTVSALPADFYSTKFYTDRIISYIDEGLNQGKPFFAYLAYTAPHNPLHAPDAYIKNYKGKYDVGWDGLAHSRLQRQLEMGIVDADVEPAPRPDFILAWDDLNDEQQAHRARDMEIYAGMISYLDYSVGRLLAYLQEAEEYENTLIIFLSDNGPSKTAIVDYIALGGEAAEFAEKFDNSLENKGKPGSSTDIGPGWAFAAATPLRLFKGYVAQGGIQVPAIVKKPGPAAQEGVIIRTPITVKDIVPTFLDIAGTEYPDASRVEEAPKLQGNSLTTLLAEGNDPELDARGLGWEAYGMDAWRHGDMKILRQPPPFGSGEWQLYDLKQDPGETLDLASTQPDLVAEMVAQWQAFVVENEVVHPDHPVAYSKPVKPGRW